MNYRNDLSKDGGEARANVDTNGQINARTTTEGKQRKTIEKSSIEQKHVFCYKLDPDPPRYSTNRAPKQTLTFDSEPPAVLDKS